MSVHVCVCARYKVTLLICALTLPLTDLLLTPLTSVLTSITYRPWLPVHLQCPS